MFKAMKRVWLVVGAVMMTISSIEITQNNISAAPVTDPEIKKYDSTVCKKYYEGKRGASFTCEAIKSAYESIEKAKDEQTKEGLQYAITQYKEVTTLYKTVAEERGRKNFEKVEELCKKYHEPNDGQKCSKIKECMEDKGKGYIIGCSEKLDDFQKTTVSSSDGNTEGSDDYSICMDNAGILGWVMCPVLNAANMAIEWGYEKIEGFFAINNNLIKSDKDSPTYKVWSNFRDIANILFVILIMVIVFSQLTGVGISNYGIKKMLPKIIVVAVLVNASFFIAQLLIDTSNIIGYSAKGFLSEGLKIQETLSSGEATGGVSNAIAVIFPLILAAGLAAIFLSLPLILSAVIAIFFMLIILAIRQSLAIALIVTSPLAAAAFLLPNTKGLFDKYWRAAKGVLMFFPMAGIMIGAGQLAGKITMGSSDSDIVKLVGFLMYFAPFAAIPSALKKSLDPVGKGVGLVQKLGGKLSGWQGRKARDVSKERRNNMRKWATTTTDADGNVRLRRGVAGYTNFSKNNPIGRALFGRAAKNFNKKIIASNASIASDNKFSDPNAINSELLKASADSASAVSEMLNNGNFQYEGRNYSARNTASLEALAQRSARIVDANGNVIQNGNETVFRAAMQALAKNGSNGDFAAIRRVITGRRITEDNNGNRIEEDYIGNGGRLSNESMMAYSAIIARNKDNENKYKALYDQAAAIDSAGTYDHNRHQLAQFQNGSFYGYDAHIFGAQKRTSLQAMDVQVQQLLQRNDDEARNQISYLYNTMARANNDERISNKWDGDKRATIANMAQRIENSEIGRSMGLNTQTISQSIRNAEIRTPEQQAANATPAPATIQQNNNQPMQNAGDNTNIINNRRSIDTDSILEWNMWSRDDSRAESNNNPRNNQPANDNDNITRKNNGGGTAPK